MKSKKEIEKKLKFDIKIDSTINDAKQNKIKESFMESKAVKSKNDRFNVNRIVRENRFLKSAIAAIIVAAAIVGLSNFIGGEDILTSAAWAETVENITISYNDFFADMKTAFEKKDFETASKKADAMSEVWQGLNMLATARLNPQTDLTETDIIKVLKQQTLYDHYDLEINEVLLGQADKIWPWLCEIKDLRWVYEVKLISKQLEEYCEELRNAFREGDVSLAEHCLNGIEAYSVWFEKLPWHSYDDPMSIELLTECIKRDLTIANVELREQKIGDGIRYCDRALKEAVRNAESLDKIDFFRSVEELANLIGYVKIVSTGYSYGRRNYVDDERTWDVVNVEFAGNENLADYFNERVEVCFWLCENGFVFPRGKYDFRTDSSLPARLVERIDSMVEAFKSGDAVKYTSNYNVEAMYKLVKEEINYKDHKDWFAGMSEQDAKNFCETFSSKVNSVEKMAEIMAQSVKIEIGELQLTRVTLDYTGKHATAYCRVENEGEKKSAHYTPQWTYFYGDWWQVDD